MITNRTIGAIALLSFGVCFPLHAGTIKGSFKAIRVLSETGNPTSTLLSWGGFPSTTASRGNAVGNIRMEITQSKKSIPKIVLTETFGADVLKTTFHPVGRYYFAAVSSYYKPERATYTATHSGAASVRVSASRSRGKSRVRSGDGVVQVTLRSSPEVLNYTVGTTTRTEVWSATTVIRASTGKPSEMSYRASVYYRGSRTNAGGNSTESITELVTGVGKASGRITGLKPLPPLRKPWWQ